MSIDDMIARDTRIDRLARACGWSRRETRACLQDIWALCYDRVVPYLPPEDIEVTALRDAISPPTFAGGIVQALIAVGLARPATKADRIFTRKDGAQMPWPDLEWRDRIYLSGTADRIGYLLSKSDAGRQGGKKSGESRRSKRKQVLRSASEDASSKPEAPANPSAPASASDPVSDPSSAAAAPPARARDPLGLVLPAWEGGSYQPQARPRDAGLLAEALWGSLSRAREAVAAELGIAAIALPQGQRGTFGSEPKGFRDLRDRIRAEGAIAPIVCQRVLANLIADARDKQDLEWLSEKAFSEGSWMRVRDRPAHSASRAPPKASGAIGAATARSDHDESDELVPFDDDVRSSNA